jgi:hypothetical protein
MRATTLLFGLFLATAGGIIRAEPKPAVSELDGYTIFTDLSKEVAAKKAREMATADFARHVYRIFVVGKRPATSAYDEYLKERYGVLMTPIAGCVVSDGIEGAQDGYNSTMRPLLNRKFGRDIFKEAEQASRK